MKFSGSIALLLVIFLAACQTNPQKNSPSPTSPETQVRQRLQELFAWYIQRPAQQRMELVLESPNPHIRNKQEYVKALRASGYFTPDFTLMQEVMLDGCEEIAQDDPQNPIPCLDKDPVTLKPGFDEFAEIDWEETSVDTLAQIADAKFELRGVSGTHPDEKQPISQRLHCHLGLSDGKWVVVYIRNPGL